MLECFDLGPLHNPANLMGIEACEAAMAGKPNVAVFDTEPVAGFRILGLRLAIAPDGRKFVVARQKGSQRFAQFAGAYARQLADATRRAMGGDVAHDQSR